MKYILQKNKDIIDFYKIIKNDVLENSYKFQVIIKLKNTTRLDARDFKFPDKRTYSYQWMKSDNTLIIRWDNAKHYPELKTFPNHMHVGSKENVQESPEMTLEKVLEIIRKKISS